MQANSSKRTILLDLGGVVFQSTGQSNELIDWTVISRLNNKYGYAFNIGEDVFPDFMRDYNSQAQQSLTGPAFLEAVFDTLDFNEALVNYLKPLGDIIIVSDNYRENIAYISERYQFSSWAQQQFYSFDYQLEKADPRFFARLVKDIDRPASSFLYIDDSPEKLASAAQFGIQGFQFINNEQLMEEVENYLSEISTPNS